MLHSSLLTYVNAALDTGLEPEVIRRNLVSAGWDAASVDAALARIVRERDTDLPEQLPQDEAEVPDPPKNNPFRPVLTGAAAIVLGIAAGQGGFLLAQSRSNEVAASVPAPAAHPPASPSMLLSGASPTPQPTETALSDVPVVTPTPKAKPTVKPTPKLTPVATPSDTPSPTPTQTPSAVPSASPSASASSIIPSITP